MKAANAIESRARATGGTSTTNGEAAETDRGPVSSVGLITPHHHLTPCTKGAA